MRNISFSLTKPQFVDESKDVTRRLSWLNLKLGESLMACEKCQGLKPGEQIVKLGEIVIMTARRERLDRMITDLEYGKSEVIREGFPHLTPAEFVAMFCKHNKCDPSDLITRIEFRHAPKQQPNPQTPHDKSWEKNFIVPIAKEMKARGVAYLLITIRDDGKATYVLDTEITTNL